MFKLQKTSDGGNFRSQERKAHCIQWGKEGVLVKREKPHNNRRKIPMLGTTHSYKKLRLPTKMSRTLVYVLPKQALKCNEL